MEPGGEGGTAGWDVQDPNAKLRAVGAGRIGGSITEVTAGWKPEIYPAIAGFIRVNPGKSGHRKYE